jgi:hypothetical protein
VSRRAVARALAIAQVPRRRLNEFLSAYRTGGLPAVAELDKRVADALALEARYHRAGVRLDPKGQFAREVADG